MRVGGTAAYGTHLNLSLSLLMYSHKRCVQKLVEAGADIRQHDNEGLTAVSY